MRDSLVTLGTTQTVTGYKKFDRLDSNNFEISQTTGTGNGISLYGSGTSGTPDYGLFFGLTTVFNNYGPVDGEWATYFKVNGPTNRGWIFKHDTTNVASINGLGAAKFASSVTASSFLESSLRKFKTNIIKFNVHALDLINKLEVVSYDRSDTEIKNKIGIIADDSPEEFLSKTKDSVDLYKTIFIQTKAIQELSEENKILREELNNLRELVMSKLDKL